MHINRELNKKNPQFQIHAVMILIIVPFFFKMLKINQMKNSRPNVVVVTGMNIGYVVVTRMQDLIGSEILPKSQIFYKLLIRKL